MGYCLDCDDENSPCFIPGGWRRCGCECHAEQKLTPAMKRHLDLMRELGGTLIAGHGEIDGRLLRISASTLAALERRGFCSISISPDGGMMGRIAPQYAEKIE